MITKNKPLKPVSSKRMIKCRTDMYGQITNRYGFSELTMIGENLKYLIIGGQEEAAVYNKNTKGFFRQDVNYNNFFYIGNSSVQATNSLLTNLHVSACPTSFHHIGDSFVQVTNSAESNLQVSNLRVLTLLTLFHDKYINSIVNRLSMFIKTENPVYADDVRAYANENKNDNLHAYIKFLENFNVGKALHINSMRSDYGINNMLYFSYLKAFEKAEHNYGYTHRSRLLYDSEKEKYISITDRLILYNIINNNMMSDIRSDKLLHVRNQWYFCKKIDYSVENIDTAQVRISEYKNPLMPEVILNKDININKDIVEGLEKKYKISLRGNAAIIKVTDVAQKTVTTEKLMIRHISIIYNRLRSILRHIENSQIYFMKNISRYRKNIQTYFAGNTSEYIENEREYLPDYILLHIKNVYGYPSDNISKNTENKWKYLPYSIFGNIKNIHEYLPENILKDTEYKWENSPDNILRHTKKIHEYLSGNILNDTENIWEYSLDNISENKKNIYGYLSGNITKDIEKKWEYPPDSMLEHKKNIHGYLSENILKHAENTWEYRSGDVLKHKKNIHEYKSEKMSEDAENIWEYKSGDVLKHKKKFHEYLSGNISENTENTHKYSSDNIWKRIHNIQVYSIDSILSYAKNIRVYSADSILSHTKNICVYSADNILSHTKNICAYSADSILSYIKNIHLHSSDSILRNTKTIQIYLNGNILSDAGNIKGFYLGKYSVYSKESILMNVENIKGYSSGKSLIYSAGSISGYTENISKDTRNSQEYYKQIKTKNVSNENRSDVSREKLVYTGQSGYKEIREKQKALNMENIQNINDIQNIKSIQSIEAGEAIKEGRAIKSIQAIEGIQNTDGLQAIQKNIINRTENIEDILLKQEKTEEINKMIDVRVQSQVKNISRQVYETIERRLKGEKRRRGF